jgi:hypothetical protein
MWIAVPGDAVAVTRLTPFRMQAFLLENEMLKLKIEIDGVVSETLTVSEKVTRRLVALAAFNETNLPTFVERSLAFAVTESGNPRESIDVADIDTPEDWFTHWNGLEADEDLQAFLRSLGKPVSKAFQRYCGDRPETPSTALNRAVGQFLPVKYITQARAQIVIDAIRVLKNELAQRYGTEVNTDAGASTIYISHDRASLTDQNNRVVARRPESIARQVQRVKAV